MFLAIAIGGFQHETNTFAPTKATYQDFVHGGGWPSMAHGAEVLGPADLPALLRDRCRSQRDVYRDDWLDGMWDRPGATTPDEFIALAVSFSPDESAVRELFARWLNATDLPPIRSGRLRPRP